MREKYLQMRKANQYDFGWFYSYFLEKKDKNRASINVNTFQQVFGMYFQMNSKVIIEHLDKEMEVTKIVDQNNQIIYID